MYTEWTKNLKNDAEKQRFEDQIRSAKPVLQRIQALLDERDFSADRFELSLSSFDNPNWAYKQAFNCGFKSALSIVRKYLEVE